MMFDTVNMTLNQYRIQVYLRQPSGLPF